jgi:predicted HTH transcriptional regulator
VEIYPQFYRTYPIVNAVRSQLSRNPTNSLNKILDSWAQRREQSVPQKQVKLPDYLNAFASILKDFPEATIHQLAQEAQLSERMIKKDLRALKEFGIIERVGSNRKGYWKFRV